jgi:hypothetical protein
MRFRLILLAAALMLGGGRAALAQGADMSRGWSVQIAPYIWLPSISGTLRYDLPGSGFRNGDPLGGAADVKVDSGDYLGNLNGAGQIAADVRYGRFSVIADVMYMNVTGTGSTLRSVDIDGVPRDPISSQVGTASSTNMKSYNLSLAAGYTVAEGSWGHLDVLGGFRWFRAEVESDYTLTGQLFGPRGTGGPVFTGSGRFSGTENIVNGIVGVRGRLQLGSGFFVPYYLDIGAGDSNFTWQGFTGIGYQTGWVGVQAGWRYLSLDQGGNSLVQDMALSGAYLGVNFVF